jgi:hypothetical protein
MELGVRWWLYPVLYNAEEVLNIDKRLGAYSSK